MKCDKCDNEIYSANCQCYNHICSECGSKNTEAYDDGEGYPPNILCKDCGSWD